MSTVENGGTLEVCESLAHVEPQKGGVQQLGQLLNSEDVNSSGNTIGTVQQSGLKLNKLVEIGAPEGCDLNEPTSSGQVLFPIVVAIQPSVPNAAQQLGLPAPEKFSNAGRKATITPQVAEQICMLLSIGFSRRQAASYLGFAAGTITNAVARDPELGFQLQRAENLSDLQPELTVMAEARKNWRAAAWYLEFKKKNPRPLTEEEKEERHQAKLADERRTAIEMNSFFEHARGGTSQPSQPQRKTRVVARRRSRG